MKIYSALGYTILNKIALEKKFPGVFSSDIIYAFIVIKPLEGYGIMDFKDKFNNSECRKEVYSTFFDTPIHDDMFENYRKIKDLFLEKGNLSLRKSHLISAHNLSTTKILDAKKRRFELDQPLDYKSLKNRFSVVSLSSCSKINFFYPVYFSLENDQDSIFRKLVIENNNLMHKRDSIGPAIRPIYWLNISNDAQELKNKTEQLQEFEKKGYIQVLNNNTLEPIQWTVTSGKVLYATVWVSYDYRIRFSRQNICNKCLEVSKILQ